MAGRKIGMAWVEGRGWTKVNDEWARDYTEYANESWAFLISFFRWYPDVMYDVFRAPDSKYKTEELIQRVMMRAFARYQFVDITGCRSATKTSTKIKQKIAENILFPATNSSYYGPSYKQQAALAKEAFVQLKKDFPAIARHYMIDSQSKDSWAISTKFGSSITINALRGQNIHDVTAEEYAQEEDPPFDYREYTSIVLYAVRLTHRVQGEDDPTFIKFKQHTITSAGRKQNHSFETRCKHLKMMLEGKSAFVMDIPWTVIVLSQMRSYSWAMQRKHESTPEEFMREMESLYTGTDENPIVRDEILTASRDLILMEEHHCCKDRDNQLKPEEVIYIVGYDVAYEDGANNAKCACAVVKLTKQKDYYRRDKYKKDVVYLDDWSPLGMTEREQARRLKQVWYRFCYEGSETYISIDCWQYGKAVTEALMSNLDDGLAPLCVINHDQYTELELEGALPVIYPIKAGGVGTTDPDSEMVRYAEIQFDNRNVSLLTSNIYAGIEAYKRTHRIKDSRLDVAISSPYKKTNELADQIRNLKKGVSGAGVCEKRISHRIQRDSWSALKYALRLAQKLEKANLSTSKRESDWDKLIREAEQGAFNNTVNYSASSRLVTQRHGGKLF